MVSSVWPPLSAFLDAQQLPAPEAFELCRPLVNGSYRLGVGAVVGLASVASNVNETDLTQHPQMFRNRRLRKLERVDDGGDGLFGRCEQFENLTAHRFGDGSE